MSTIADVFLNDFESDEEEADSLAPSAVSKDDDEVEQVDVVDVGADSDSDEERDVVNQVEGVSNLLNEDRLKQHMEKIRNFANEDASAAFVGRAEDNPEYEVIIESNKIIQQLDSEIHTVFKFVRDIYATRFSELEKTVVHPVEYAKVVKLIGNQTDIQNVRLQEIVSDHTKLTITIAASATTGKKLPEFDLKRLIHGCDVIIELDERKKRAFQLHRKSNALRRPEFVSAGRLGNRVPTDGSRRRFARSQQNSDLQHSDPRLYQEIASRSFRRQRQPPPRTPAQHANDRQLSGRYSNASDEAGRG
eukprot:641568_1